ncbi:hypothetical protein Vafri_2522 [Volvox africanus]|uniref:Retrotransposon gag domain-containing protein n=1 Tax=Volvox africanus TaxID=51714 RepID=A0A8J4ASE2_9CHLO|nr:hypothetical protein Vafri_2522 [Volvox africanus]
MASGGDELGLTGGGSQADLTTVPRMSWRGPFDQSIDRGVQDPVALPVLQTPAHPFVPLAATTVGPARNEEQGRPPSSLRQGHDDGDEVIKLSIPVPKLHISADMKQKNAERSTADATLAYLRDVRKYLLLVRGGDRDAVKCLFVGNTLEGMAKTWYDQWTTARENFTYDELTAALLARFTPEVQPRDVEARHTLALGTYRMHPNETIPSYQSRFEALVTPIADLSEGDRIFWFQRGLSESLAGECATDLMGRKFQSYGDLVQFARGAEMRFLAKQGALRPVPRVNAVQAQDPAYDAAHVDQGTDVRSPTAATTVVRTDQGRSVRGVSGTGTRVSTGAGPSSGPVRGKRKGGLPSDASDDFISSAEVNALGLSPQSSEWSQVTLADGGKHPILGRITLSLGVGPLRITTQPYVLQELTDAATYILGSSTLRQYGASIDMESATLRLRKGTLSCKVPFVSFASVGPEGGRSEAEPVVNFAVAAMQKRTEPKSVGRKEADRMIRKGAHALLVRPGLHLNAATTSTSADPEVEALLQGYADVFRDVPGLPPMRPVDHTIPLVPGAQPVSRPMYRLSPLELDEVKRQVTDLLAKGMIRGGSPLYA